MSIGVSAQLHYLKCQGLTPRMTGMELQWQM